MHDSPPSPHTATYVIHLLGGPLDGADIEAADHVSEITFTEDTTYGTGTIRISLAGESYIYSAYLSAQRPTFRHHRLPWDYGSK